MTGRTDTAIVPVRQGINESGTLTLPLPSGVSLLGCQVAVKEEDCPQIPVRTVLSPTHDTSRSIILIGSADRPAYIYSVEGAGHPVSWDGRIRLGEDYEYNLIAYILNFSGTIKDFQLNAWVE